MNLTFYKYQGTGNDFIILDNRSLFFPKNNTKLIGTLCDRRFGVGADGLILLENDEQTDFRMVYYNADGNESTMCGNGGRCIVAYARFLNIISHSTVFNAIDGEHEAYIKKDDTVRLKMKDVNSVHAEEQYVFLDTGSPHHVQLVEELDSLNVKKHGAAIRYGKYGQKGSNVNFVKKRDENRFHVRTYERGVEDETLSCGTGVTAVAIAMFHQGETASKEVTLLTPGGDLKVAFESDGKKYLNVFLEGKANFVFKGEVIC